MAFRDMGMNRESVVYLDRLRIVACFMVLAIRASEPFYLSCEALVLRRLPVVGKCLC